MFDGSLGAGGQAVLLLALAIALGFEFVNGFHDTANAVATVIYTRSLSPRRAVAWSGFCNFVGNFAGAHIFGLAVAFSVVHLLPVDLLVDIGSGRGMAMVVALLLGAIAWNLGTWFVGIPASSTHTLVGAILGVGLVDSALRGHPGAGVNWYKAGEVGVSLLISPLIGFVLSFGLLRLIRALNADPALYQPPEGDAPPPPWIRSTLIATCTGVSLAHGANDGQKGVGLIMLILIGLLPARYALSPDYDARRINRAIAQAGALADELTLRGGLPAGSDVVDDLRDLEPTFRRLVDQKSLSNPERWAIRTALLEADARLGKLLHDHTVELTDRERSLVAGLRGELRGATEFAPTWVLLAVATALGIGTMVGWKRIVVTVGEKIGKDHLTYAQGASAELVAMGTIGLAVGFGMPVSTTHVLSSGVAGTMAASGTGVQMATVRNIALAWVLTLPAAMLLSGGLYLGLRGLF